TLLPLLSILFCILHPPQPTLFPYTTLFRSDKKSSLLGCVLELLISTAGGRFHFITAQGRHLFKETTLTVSTLPRALLEPPCASHYGVSRLMGLHYRSSHRRPFAIPAGQGRLRQRYIARRKLICIFEESPPSVPINGVVLRTTKDGISYSSDYKEAKTFIPHVTGSNTPLIEVSLYEIDRDESKK